MAANSNSALARLGRERVLVTGGFLGSHLAAFAAGLTLRFLSKVGSQRGGHPQSLTNPGAGRGVGFIRNLRVTGGVVLRTWTHGRLSRSRRAEGTAPSCFLQRRRVPA